MASYTIRYDPLGEFTLVSVIIKVVTTDGNYGHYFTLELPKNIKNLKALRDAIDKRESYTFDIFDYQSTGHIIELNLNTGFPSGNHTHSLIPPSLMHSIISCILNSKFVVGELPF